MNLEGEQNYVDQYGKIWPLHAHIGKITSERALFNKFGFRFKQEHQKTLYFYCTKKKSDGGLCPFRGIYLKSNECLYIKGEHEHKHTKKAVEVEKIKIPKNIGDDYVDNYGKIWKFNKQIEKNAKYKMLYDIGFTNNWKRKSGIHLRCRKNGPNGECNFAGIYLNNNGCLYTRGEHNHVHTEKFKTKNNGKKFGGTEVSKMVETDCNLGEIVVNNNNLDDSIPQQQHTVEILANENEQLNDEEQQIRNENYEELVQLKKCRQQFCIKLDDLRKNFIQQKAEFAKKEALMQRVIDQLTSEINKSNCRTLPENVSRMEMMEQQPIAERQEMIQENSIDSNSNFLTTSTFDENNCGQSNNSFRMMPTISPNVDATFFDMPCTSSSLNMDEPSTSAASFNHSQSPSPADMEIVEECKNGPIGPPLRKREEREVQIGPTITIDEEDRPWMCPAFRRQSIGRVKKEEPAEEDMNMAEANEKEMDQPGPSSSTNGKNGGGGDNRRQQNDEIETEPTFPRLLRERKQRINYKD